MFLLFSIAVWEGYPGLTSAYYILSYNARRLHIIIRRVKYHVRYSIGHGHAIRPPRPIDLSKRRDEPNRVGARRVTESVLSMRISRCTSSNWILIGNRSDQYASRYRSDAKSILPTTMTGCFVCTPWMAYPQCYQCGRCQKCVIL